MAGHVSPYIRIPFFHERGPGVGVDLSLQERLDELYADERKADRVDIGFRRVDRDVQNKDTISEWRKFTRRNRELERAARKGTLQVDIGKVTEEWIESGAAFSEIYKAAELYGIYEDLFRHGYFYPCVNLDVAFAQEEDDMMVPVYRGNVVKPREAASSPEVQWTSKEDDLWCLVMTGLDSHLIEEGQEYLHWMVANIKGSDLESGEEIASYMQPFPPFGSGYHRYAFVLYKQEELLDLSKEKRSQEYLLQERTFNTFDFYSKHQDQLTPAGLSFFQSDYDTSLRDFFHNKLNMKEPRYEYEFPLPYIKQWNRFSIMDSDQGFNEFLDKHRDPKDIEKEVLIKKLKHTHPYLGDLEGHLKYPEAHEEDLLETFPPPVGQKPLNRRQSYKIPSWRRLNIMKEKSKSGYFASTDHVELRRDPPLSAQ